MPRGVRAGLAVLALVVLAPRPALGHGVQVPSPDPVAQVASNDGERSRLADELEEITANEADVVRRVEQARAEAARQTAELARLDGEIVTIGERLKTAKAAVVEAEAAVRAADDAVRAANADVEASRQRLERYAIAAYIGHGQLPTLRFTFADRKAQAQVAVHYAQVANDVRQAEVEGYRAAKTKVEHLGEEAAAAQTEAEGHQADVAHREAQLKEQRAQQELTRQRAAAAVASEEALAAEVQAAKTKVQARLAEIKKESDALAALIRARGSSSKPSTPATTAKPAAAKPATTAKPTATTVKAAATTAKPAATTAKPAAATAGGAPASTAAAANTTAKPAATTAPPATTAKPAATTPATTAKPSATTQVTAAPPGPYSTAAPPIDATLSYPIPGAPIVSGWGMRTQPVLGVYRMHEGIDIWAPANTPILAAGSGKVIWAGDRGGYGIAVIIDHGRGLSTVYAHNSSVAVSVGQTVAEGEVISYVGQTGHAGGPHLHFEVRIDGIAYNPRNFVTPR